MVYSDKTSSFEKLLETGRSVTIHIRNLQILAAEIFKLRKDLASTIFSERFLKRSVRYNLRHFSEFSDPNMKSTFHGTESLSHLRPKIWDLASKVLKELSRLSAFKRQLKSGSVKIVLVDYVKSAFEISVLFDTFFDDLDKAVLPKFVSFVRAIRMN